jgi:hypothetical protein
MDRRSVRILLAGRGPKNVLAEVNHLIRSSADNGGVMVLYLKEYKVILFQLEPVV